MHPHFCPLCEKDYSCGMLGCEELPSNVCPDCYDPADDEVNVGQVENP